jgi:hypothetical protein
MNAELYATPRIKLQLKFEAIDYFKQSSTEISTECCDSGFFDTPGRASRRELDDVSVHYTGHSAVMYVYGLIYDSD